MRLTCAECVSTRQRRAAKPTYLAILVPFNSYTLSPAFQKHVTNLLPMPVENVDKTCVQKREGNERVHDVEPRLLRIVVKFRREEASKQLTV